MAAIPFPPPSLDEETQDFLTHANRIAAIGQLSASIAHEVSQPIGATLLNAQAALDGLSNPRLDLEQIRLALSRIVREDCRAASVLSALLALARRTPPITEHCELNEVILEVVELTHGEAVENFVSVTTQLADRLPVVWGDRIQLQQVVLNLVINAIQAMCDGIDAPRALGIHTESDATRVSVSVQDTGTGLDPGSVGRLFKAFYTTKADNLGVGLSICRQIIESHRGSIWADRNEGRGSTFRFSVPRDAGPPEDRRPLSTPPRDDAYEQS
jgi:C4-dicarboxylate-specific signal transduction histidine kinase